MRTVEDLTSYKKIAVLIHPKKSCHYRALICTDDPDCWLLTIVNYQGRKIITKDTVGITVRNTILEKDFSGVLSNWQIYGGYKILIRTNQPTENLNKFIRKYLTVMRKLNKKQSIKKIR